MDLHGCTVTLTPEDRTCEVAGGTTVLEALARLDLQVTAPCGGEGTCGKCRVQVTGSVDPPGPDERGLLTAEQLAAGMRLACHARVRGPVQVSVPASSRTSAIRILPAGVSRAITPEPAVAKQVVHFRPQTLSEPHARLEHLRRCGDLRADLRADLELLRQLPRLLDGSEKTVTAVSRDDYLIAVEEGDTSARCFGLALDLGTTTVVASLVDLATGREAGHAATLNRQTAYGHDVIARINMTIEEEQGLEKLRQAALESLEEATAQVLERQGVRRDEVYEATLVGNTSMMHLCLGISPASLGHLPYVGLVGDPVEMPVRDLGLSLHPRARLYVLPNIAGFVGADTVGAILASGLDEDDGRIRMMADIGTNCEIALRHGERLFVTSTPAGPAFEGARITCGMYAVPGAIEEIHLDEDVRYKVIGGGEPRGLCGSALIDVGAELLRVGLVDFTGRMVDPEELDPGVSPALRRRLVVHGGEPAVLLAEPASGSPVVLTQRDLRELQLAKGSIRTAIDLLIEGAGLTVDAVDEFCLAGGFGNYIDKANAMRLGLIPAMPLDKLRFIGNGALVGARLALLSRRLRQRGTQVARQSEHLQVAKTADFQARFAEAMLFT